MDFKQAILKGIANMFLFLSTSPFPFDPLSR